MVGNMINKFLGVGKIDKEPELRFNEEGNI